MEEDKHLPNLLFFGSHILISRVHLSTMGFFSRFQRVCFKPVAHLNCSTLPKDAHQTNSSSFPSRFQKNRSKKTEKYLAAHLPLPPHLFAGCGKHAKICVYSVIYIIYTGLHQPTTTTITVYYF